MDDFIYFLFLIAWLAFSFYQQGAKKKKRQQQMKEARERERNEQQDSPQEESARMEQPVEGVPRKQEQQPDFRKTLEEILLGEEHEEDVYREPVEQPAKTQSQQGYPEQDNEWDKNIYQKYYDEELLDEQLEDAEEEHEKMEDKIEELEQEMTLQEEDTLEKTDEKVRFDLRKAVIYSEILNRRYN